MGDSKPEIVAKKDEVIEMGQRDVEMQGVTNYPNATDNDDSVCGSVAGFLITSLSILLIILTFPFSLCVCLKMVQEYERAVIFRLGRIKEGGPVGPGLFFIIPCMDQIVVTDLRTISFDVPPQEILTKDSVTVAVDAVVYYKIQNPMAAVCNVSDYSKSTRLLASTTLRTILGTRNLSEILSDREHIASAILGQLDSATDPWGIKVERVEVKDVRLPQQLQRAMAAEAEAAREARAKVIAAEGEHKSSRALAHAAEVIAQSPAALQLRYLQTLNSISAENNSTVIFPVPIDILNSFMQFSSSTNQQQYGSEWFPPAPSNPPPPPPHCKTVPGLPHRVTPGSGHRQNREKGSQDTADDGKEKQNMIEEIEFQIPDLEFQ